MIVLMLNLLISIIAEAQGQYTASKNQQTYREKALQIRQKGLSFFWPLCRHRSHRATTLANALDALYVVHQASSQKQLEEQVMSTDEMTAKIYDLIRKMPELIKKHGYPRADQDGAAAEVDAAADEQHAEAEAEESSGSQDEGDAEEEEEEESGDTSLDMPSGSDDSDLDFAP